MWLIGMMGSGKSTVGSLVAQELGLAFIDTDLVVSQRAGMSIPEIWQRLGEKEFRELERDAVSSVPFESVAAAGGGAVLDQANREAIASSPPVVWLRTSPETLARRVGDGEGRPLIASGHAEERLAHISTQRSHLYLSLATHIVDTDALSADQVAAEVVSIWRS